MGLRTGPSELAPLVWDGVPPASRQNPDAGDEEGVAGEEPLRLRRKLATRASVDGDATLLEARVWVLGCIEDEVRKLRDLES